MGDRWLSRAQLYNYVIILLFSHVEFPHVSLHVSYIALVCHASYPAGQPITFIVFRVSSWITHTHCWQNCWQTTQRIEVIENYAQHYIYIACICVYSEVSVYIIKLESKFRPLYKGLTAWLAKITTLILLPIERAADRSSFLARTLKNRSPD